MSLKLASLYKYTWRKLRRKRYILFLHKLSNLDFYKDLWAWNFLLENLPKFQNKHVQRFQIILYAPFDFNFQISKESIHQKSQSFCFV